MVGSKKPILFELVCPEAVLLVDCPGLSHGRKRARAVDSPSVALPYCISENKRSEKPLLTPIVSC